MNLSKEVLNEAGDWGFQTWEVITCIILNSETKSFFNRKGFVVLLEERKKITVKIEEKAMASEKAQKTLINKTVKVLNEKHEVHYPEMTLLRYLFKHPQAENFLLKLLNEIKKYERLSRAHTHLYVADTNNFKGFNQYRDHVTKVVLETNAETKSMLDLYKMWSKTDYSGLFLKGRSQIELKCVSRHLIFKNVFGLNFPVGRTRHPNFRSDCDFNDSIISFRRDILFLDQFSPLPVVIAAGGKEVRQALYPTQLCFILQKVFLGRRYRNISLQLSTLPHASDYPRKDTRFKYFNTIHNKAANIFCSQLVFDKTSSLFKYMNPASIEDFTTLQWKIFLSYQHRYGLLNEKLIDFSFPPSDEASFILIKSAFN